MWPFTSIEQLFIPASSPAWTSNTTNLKPFFSQYLVYILYNISAQSQASVPPAPLWISRIQSFLSYGPFKRRSNFNSSVLLLNVSKSVLICFSNSSSLSNSRRFNNSMVSSISFFKLSKELTVFFISDVSLMNCSAFFWSCQKVDSFILVSLSFISSFFWSMSKWPP